MSPSDLVGTERYIGCYDFLNGELGLSFKGLASELRMSLCGAQRVIEPGTFVALKPSSDKYSQFIQRALSLWEGWQYLVKVEQGRMTLDESAMESVRRNLSRAYREFVEEYGTLRANRKKFACEGVLDPRLSLLVALEVEEDGEIVPAQILSQRVFYPPAALDEQRFFEGDLDNRVRSAYLVSLNQYQKINLPAIAALAGCSLREAEASLLQQEIAVRKPIL